MTFWNYVFIYSRYKKFSKESAKSKNARKRKMEGEAAEAEEMAAEMGLKDGSNSCSNLFGNIL